VDNISFDIEHGEIFGLLGPNGAGKTTTLSMLSTMLKPTSGSATVNGIDIEHDEDGVRKSIGIVFQDQSLDEELTCLGKHGLSRAALPDPYRHTEATNR
jgi:ABC-2 type transport system ATP-binding protein